MQTFTVHKSSTANFRHDTNSAGPRGVLVTFAGVLLAAKALNVEKADASQIDLHESLSFGCSQQYPSIHCHQTLLVITNFR